MNTANPTIKVYFDLDSVLADFNGGVSELCGIQPQNQAVVSKEDDDAMWRAIREVEHFYNKLELMPGAKEMFDFVYGILGDNCQILSGIPKAKRGIVTAGEDKTEWSHRMLNPSVKVNIVYTEQKKDFCTGQNCILVDDLQKNIDAWEEYGGIGILHENAETSIKALKEILCPKDAGKEKNMDEMTDMQFKAVINAIIQIIKDNDSKEEIITKIEALIPKE